MANTIQWPAATTAIKALAALPKGTRILISAKTNTITYGFGPNLTSGTGVDVPKDLSPALITIREDGTDLWLLTSSGVAEVTIL